LRYDFYPTVTEIHNAESFFNPSLLNPVTGLKGALQFTGSGANTCNCATPVSNSYKNFGPRFGLAYQLDSKTVIRGSYGLMFTHGNAVGGLNTSIGTLGFSAGPSFSSNGSFLSTFPLHGAIGAIPAFTAATGTASGPAYGTGYTNTSGYTGTPSSGMNYDDPHYGGRAPEFVNWSFGIQRQLTHDIALTVTYVGSEGHFLQADDNAARGYWADQLDPRYLLTAGSHLADKGAAIATDCTTYSLPCPANSLMNTGQQLFTFLKPFPFQSVTDNFGQYSTNANYNSVQTIESSAASPPAASPSILSRLQSGTGRLANLCLPATIWNVQFWVALPSRVFTRPSLVRPWGSPTRVALPPTAIGSPIPPSSAHRH
jgi:hypothetical protein